MEKTDLILEMLEHPTDYTEQQWQDILADQDCRRLYDMLSLAANARQAEEPTDGEIREQWVKLEHARRKFKIQNSKFKAAAVITALLVISGLAFAAISSGVFSHEAPETPVVAEQTADTTVNEVRKDTAVAVKPVVAEPVTFDNVALDMILTDIAAHYKMQLTWKRTEPKTLRLHFIWKKTDSIEQVAEALNKFQRFHISIVSNTIIVE